MNVGAAAVPARWVATYFAFCAGVLGPLSTMPGAASLAEGLATPAEAGAMAAAGAGVGVALALVIALGVTWWTRREVRLAVARRARPLDGVVVAIGACYVQVKGRYRRRPPAAIIVTRDALELVAARAKDAAVDLVWPLGEVERLEPTGDRFGLLAKAFDMQGALSLGRGETTLVVSVVGSRRFLEAVEPAWGAALSQAPPARPAPP